MLYFTLYHSLVKWFESRGSNFSSARFAAGCALTAAMFMNFLAAAALIQFANGPHLINWLVEHQALSGIFVAAIAAVHWRIGKAVRSRAEKRLVQNHDLAEPSKYLWVWYVVPTFILWAAVTAVGVVSMSPY